MVTYGRSDRYMSVWLSRRMNQWGSDGVRTRLNLYSKDYEWIKFFYVTKCKIHWKLRGSSIHSKHYMTRLLFIICIFYTCVCYWIAIKYICRFRQTPKTVICAGKDPISMKRLQYEIPWPTDIQWCRIIYTMMETDNLGSCHYDAAIQYESLQSCILDGVWWTNFYYFILCISVHSKTFSLRHCVNGLRHHANKKFKRLHPLLILMSLSSWFTRKQRMDCSAQHE